MGAPSQQLQTQLDNKQESTTRSSSTCHIHRNNTKAPRLHTSTVYTDGSKMYQYIEAAVWSSLYATYEHLSDHISIFTTELYAILLAINYAINSDYQNFLIIFDSLLALKALQSQNISENEIQGIFVNKIYESPKNFQFMWASSHVGPYGNEQADSLAKWT